MINQSDSPKSSLGRLSGMIFCTLIGALMLFGGIFTFIYNYQHYNLLRQEGISTMGIVTDLDDHTEIEGNTIYIVHYSYNVPSGGENAMQTSQQQVSKLFFSNLSTGQTIEIIYAPSQTSVSRIKAVFGPPVFDILFFGLSLFFFAIGLVSIVNILPRLRKTNPVS
jgi:hypothetical protein